MLFLPRSPRGTWLLAGAVWLAACAGWWWALPPAPRAVMRFPENAQLLGIGPDAVSALVLLPHSCHVGVFSESGFDLAIVNCSTGQREATLLSDCGMTSAGGFSRDRRHWLLHGGSYREIIRSDLVDHKLERIPNGPIESDVMEPLRYSDGLRYRVMMNRKEGGRLLVWDLDQNREIAIEPPVRMPFAFSSDDRFLVAVSRDEWSIRVIELPSGQTVRKLNDIGDERIDRVCVNSDGTVVSALIIVNRGSIVWWDAKGKHEFDIGIMTDSFISADGQELIGTFASPVGIDLQVRDTATGAVRLSVPSEFIKSTGLISDDGRIALATKRQPRGWTMIDDWIQRFSIPINVKKTGECHFGEFFDLETGRSLGSLEGKVTYRYCGMEPEPPPPFHWISGISAVAVESLDEPNTWYIWDLPKSKSLTWFAVGAANLALPLALFARRRVRKLRAA
jgi:hypothetical protein